MADFTDKQRARPANPLRVGVIGLGPRWQRWYRPALEALRERLQVSALCDQVQERALVEGRRLGCAAVAGPTELIERHDTDAVLLVDRQWYRLWPLEVACRHAKPVFCCDSLARDDKHADALYRRVQRSGLPVMMALSARCAPAAALLEEVLGKHAARSRIVVCSVFTSFDGRKRAKDPNLGLGPDWLGLLDWCMSLLTGAPSRILATGLPDGSLDTVLLGYQDGRAVQLNWYRRPGAARTCRLQVLTDQGTAVARWPKRVRWADAQGQVLPHPPKHPPLAQTLLEQFHGAVTEGRSPVPGLAHAYRLLGWWRLAQRSYQESRWIEVPDAGA